MKLSCLQENINRGLNLVGRAAATRTTLPITNNILLATDQGRLKLVATNLEMAISCWIGAKVEEEGAITVPARLITEFVASLPGEKTSGKLVEKKAPDGHLYKTAEPAEPEKVDLKLSPNGKTLELKCARFEARISGVDACEFPPIPKVEEGISTRVDAEALRQCINHVVFAAAVDESRPVLTGVNAEFEGSVLTMAAADGFRLAVYKLPLLDPVAKATTAIIPARTLGELNRLAADFQGPVTVRLNTGNSQVLFRIDDIELVSQLIQGAFPKYTQLIPQSYSTRAVIDVDQFLRATRTASIFARDGSGIVRLVAAPGAKVNHDRLVVSARSEEVGDDVGEIDASIQGEEAKIAFNGKYLMQVLDVLRQPQVALEITSPSSPGVFKPVGADNYIHVVMPMFVQW